MATSPRSRAVPVPRAGAERLDLRYTPRPMPPLTIWATRLFPLVVLLTAAAAWVWPWALTPAKPAIVPLLMVIMLGMGMTLRGSDFVRAARDWRVVAAGVGVQYLVMPAAALALSRGLGLSPMATVGAVLVGACPGGTASNVITYLAGGRVALSITMTLVSTLLAVVATPWLTWLYAGHLVPIPVWTLFLGVLQIIVAPVLVGTLLNTFLPRWVGRLEPVWPILSMLAIALIIGIVVGLNADGLAAVGAALAAVVVLHNTLGLAAGYAVGWVLGDDAPTRRTLSIEVGLQNSGLAVALAGSAFGAAAMLPGALFSAWQNFAGAALAAFWRWRDAARTLPQPGPGLNRDDDLAQPSPSE